MMRRFLLMAIPFVVLAGCAGNVRENVGDEVSTFQKGPDSAPQKNHTNMAESLRCMDKLFLENGVRDLVVLTEDIRDNTKKLNVGARDMLTSAVSDMTRRSRAVRLITFGGDVANLVNWLNASGSNNRVYTFKPDFDIRGSISQMDDNLVQQRDGGGVTLGPLNLDKSSDASAAVLGLDMSIISTQTMELIPGVVSRNSIVVIKEGESKGGSVTGSIHKNSLGVNYDFSFNRNEGSSQAARTLIELSAIELFGKLARVPYWSCLGVDSNHQVVKEEVSDWYYTLNEEQKLVPYIQNQFRVRGVYSGPLDGSLNRDFLAVVPKARKALGLNESNQIDEALFEGIINLRSKSLGTPKYAVAHLTLAQLQMKKANRMKKRGESDVDDSIMMPKPRRISISSPAVKPGENIVVKAKATEDTFMYCYLSDGGQNVMRIFPNRFQNDPLIRKGKAIDFPDTRMFQLKSAAKGTKDNVTCFNTAADILNQMSPAMRGFDFEALGGVNVDKIRHEIASVSSGAFTEASLEIHKR